MQIDGNHISPYTIDVPGRETIPGKWRVSPYAAESRDTRRTGRRLRTGDFALLMAGLSALVGTTAGIIMGISQDFTIAPAHAHLNLLGWVTMALYGLYHRSIGRVGGWLGWTQVLTGALGAALMASGLALYLSEGDHRFMPLVVVGSLLAFLGMALFVAVVLVDLLEFGRTSAGHGRAAG